MSVTNTQQYSFTAHLHRFAVWTAARAAQRCFTTTANIQQAIEETGLAKSLAELDTNTISPKEYDDFHRDIATRLQAAFAKKNLLAKATYGRVAKIIAIYVKTSYIIRYPDTALSKVVHPPVDRILLQRLARGNYDFSVDLKKINWTQLDQETYFQLIDDLRRFWGDRPFWKIEAYWRPADI